MYQKIRIFWANMKKLAHDEIQQKRYTPESLAGLDRHPIIVLVDSVRSLYNVGSIFRTADGARIRKLYLCGYTPHPPRREIDKTALGATATVPWEYCRDPLVPIATMKAAGIPIVVLEQTDASTPYFQLERKDFPLCLVVGNEITGVSREIVREADRAIDIPMFGMKQSLNVAVAFGIAVFGLLERWQHSSR
jgi:tRNA G18 (ribose-2'-O)-methylase SpoU